MDENGDDEDSLEYRKTMTSAVPGMEISETREALAEMRLMWENHSPFHLFYSCNELLHTPHLTCSQFAFLYLHGQIKKRNLKNTKTVK